MERAAARTAPAIECLSDRFIVGLSVDTGVRGRFNRLNVSQKVGPDALVDQTDKTRPSG
jgi:hypothetical protein